MALASKPASSRKCPAIGSRTALLFDLLKTDQDYDQFFCVLKNARELAKNFEAFFSWRTLEIFEKFTKFWNKDFFLRLLRVVSLVLGIGLENFCSWPRESLSLVGLSLTLASDFFVFLVLVLASSFFFLDSSSIAYAHLKYGILARGNANNTLIQ